MSEDNFARFVLSFHHLRGLAELVQAPSPFDSPNSSANSLICVTKHHLCCTFLGFWKTHNTYHVSTTMVKREHFYFPNAVPMSPDAKERCVVLTTHVTSLWRTPLLSVQFCPDSTQLQTQLHMLSLRRLHSLRMPVQTGRPDCLATFLDRLQIWRFWQAPLGLHDLLKRITPELREVLYLYLLVYSKGYNSGTASWGTNGTEQEMGGRTSTGRFWAHSPRPSFFPGVKNRNLQGSAYVGGSWPPALMLKLSRVHQLSHLTYTNSTMTDRGSVKYKKWLKTQKHISY